MKNFKKGGFGGGFKGGDRGGFKPRFGGSDRGDRPQMHQATCNECQKACEVPFRPTGERPVYCRDCFSSKNPEQSRDFSPRPARPSFGGGSRQSFGAPRQDFRREREASPDNSAALRDLTSQVQALGGKLDRLIETLSAKTPVKAEPKDLTSAVKKAVSKKAVKKAGKK